MLRKYKTTDAYLKFTKNPFMYAFHKWSYVVIDEQEYIIDKTCTTKQCYAMYKRKFKDTGALLPYEEFVIELKAARIDFTGQK